MKGNFEKLISSSKPILIDFYADWCGPCKAQMPILKKLAESLKDQIRIIKINIDTNQAITSRYSVKSVPTLMLFKEGNLLWRKSGLQTNTQLTKVIEEHS